MVKNGENVNSSIQKMYAVFFAFGKKKKQMIYLQLKFYVINYICK